MAKSSATWEGRRALTDNPNLSVSNALEAAENLMEQDLLTEAAVFYDKADSDEGLMDIIKKAVEEGNFFIFQNAAARLKNGRPDKALLEELKARAEKSGKALYAAKASDYLVTY